MKSSLNTKKKIKFTIHYLAKTEHKMKTANLANFGSKSFDQATMCHFSIFQLSEKKAPILFSVPFC